MSAPTSEAESLHYQRNGWTEERKHHEQRPARQRRDRLPRQPDPRGLAPHPGPPGAPPPRARGGGPVRRQGDRARDLDRLTRVVGRQTGGLMSPPPDMMGVVTQATVAPLVGRDAELE